MSAALEPAPGALHVFMAGTSAGALGFSLPARHPGHPRQPRDAGRVTLDAATALSHAEPWLAVLEDWLGEGLVPNLSSATEPALAARLFTRHAALHEQASGATIYLPLAALRLVETPPPRALSVWAWQSMPCDLLLDCVALSSADTDALRPGALVILPASFSSEWQARLRPVGRRAGLYGARLRESHGRLAIEATGPLDSSTPDEHITLSLARPIDIALHELMGWPSHPGIHPIGRRLSDTQVVLEAVSAAGQALQIAMGSLMPLGSGHAVRVDRLLADTRKPIAHCP